MLKYSIDDNGSYAIQNSACQIVGWKPKATDPTLVSDVVSKLSAGLESGTLLIENASKFNFSLCVGKSRLLTQSCQLQNSFRTATLGKLQRLSQILTGILRHSKLPEWVQPCY